MNLHPIMLYNFKFQLMSCVRIAVFCELSSQPEKSAKILMAKAHCRAGGIGIYFLIYERLIF